MAVDTHAATSAIGIPKSDRLRVFLIASILPAVLVVANQWMMDWLGPRASMPSVVLVLFVYVAEVAAIAVVAGKGIRQAWLAWALFLWLILTVNMQLVVAEAAQIDHWWRQPSIGAASFLVAQLGFLIVWAVLGPGRWHWRVPAASVAVVCFLASGWYLSQGLNYGLWDAILVLNMASLVLLSLVFRFAGFRLYSPTEAAAGGQILQFGLRHILVLMVALSIALAAARGAEMLTWLFVRNLWRDMQLWRLLIACLSALLVGFAFWAALGGGRWWLRTVLLVGACLALGVGMVVYSQHALKSWRVRGLSPGVSWDQVGFMQLEYWWIAWFGLSTGLLTACLLFFRMREFRLGRRV